MLRESQRVDEDRIEGFRQQMIAAHPEHTKEINADFERAISGEFADPMDDPEDMPRMDANSLEAALTQMRELGIGFEG